MLYQDDHYLPDPRGNPLDAHEPRQPIIQALCPRPAKARALSSFPGHDSHSDSGRLVWRPFAVTLTSTGDPSISSRVLAMIR